MSRKSHNIPVTIALFPLLCMACGGGDAESADAEAPAAEAEVSATEAHAAMAGLVNPNLASAEELEGVPGMTAEAAAAIGDAKPFLRMADLHAVLAGAVGEDVAMAAYESLWLRINLNDVTDEEILLIPGVGERMAHEFEEYRPYADLDEFRREIGKYVDEEEVARLEQYVYLPIDLNSATRDEILAVPGLSERMAHEFEEYRPYTDLDQFRREIGKYVDEGEVARLERYVTLN